MSAPMTPTPTGSVEPGAVEPGTRATLGRVIADQRKTILVAVVLMVASLWIAGPLGEWVLAGCICIGIALGLANHLATELWLLKIITSGDQPSRNKMAGSTFIRLLILTVVAVGIAVAFWPSGIGLLIGLALFRLIALVMTSLPLLKELKKA